MQVVVGTRLYNANKNKICGIWVHLVFFLEYWSSTEASTWHCVYRTMGKTILNTTVWIAKWGSWNSCYLRRLNPTFLGICVARTSAIMSHLLFSAVGFQPGMPIWQTALCCFVLTSFHAQHHSLHTQCILFKKCPSYRITLLQTFAVSTQIIQKPRVHLYTVALCKWVNKAQTEQHWHQDAL